MLSEWEIILNLLEKTKGLKWHRSTSVHTVLGNICQTVAVIYNEGNFIVSIDVLKSILYLLLEYDQTMEAATILQDVFVNETVLLEIDWMDRLVNLMEVFFHPRKSEMMRLVTLKTLQQVSKHAMLIAEEAMLERVIIPHLSNIDQEQSVLLTTRGVRIIVFVAQNYTLVEHQFSALIDILDRCLCAPNMHYVPTRIAILGLIGMFRDRISQIPQKYALILFQTLIKHMSIHDSQSRMAIVVCLSNLRATKSYRVFLENSENGSQSALLRCHKRSSDSSTTEILDTSLLIEALLTLLKQEKNWNVYEHSLYGIHQLLINGYVVRGVNLQMLATFVCQSLLQCTLANQVRSCPDLQTRVKLYLLAYRIVDALSGLHTVSFESEELENVPRKTRRMMLECFVAGIPLQLSKTIRTHPTEIQRLCLNALSRCCLEWPLLVQFHFPQIIDLVKENCVSPKLALDVMQFLRVVSQTMLVNTEKMHGKTLESIVSLILQYSDASGNPDYVLGFAIDTLSHWFVRMSMPQRITFGKVITDYMNKIVARLDHAPASVVACLDLVAWYTYANLRTTTTETALEKKLLEGGPTQHWLKGNGILSIQTGAFGWSKVTIRRSVGTTSWLIRTNMSAQQDYILQSLDVFVMSFNQLCLLEPAGVDNSSGSSSDHNGENQPLWLSKSQVMQNRDDFKPEKLDPASFAAYLQCAHGRGLTDEHEIDHDLNFFQDRLGFVMNRRKHQNSLQPSRFHNIKRSSSMTELDIGVPLDQGSSSSGEPHNDLLMSERGYVMTADDMTRISAKSSKLSSGNASSLEVPTSNSNTENSPSPELTLNESGAQRASTGKWSIPVSGRQLMVRQGLRSISEHSDPEEPQYSSQESPINITTDAQETHSQEESVPVDWLYPPLPSFESNQQSRETPFFRSEEIVGELKSRNNRVVSTASTSSNASEDGTMPAHMFLTEEGQMLLHRRSSTRRMGDDLKSEDLADLETIALRFQQPNNSHEEVTVDRDLSGGALESSYTSDQSAHSSSSSSPKPVNPLEDGMIRNSIINSELESMREEEEFFEKEIHGGSIGGVVLSETERVMLSVDAQYEAIALQEGGPSVSHADIINSRTGSQNSEDDDKTNFTSESGNSAHSGTSSGWLESVLLSNSDVDMISLNPAFVQLQIQNSSQGLPLEAGDTLDRGLKLLDRTPCRSLDKVAVVYVAEGQHKEDEFLLNNVGSARYEQLLTKLGNKVRLAGTDKYTAGLDRELDQDGEFMLYWEDPLTEMVLHCTTMMGQKHEMTAEEVNFRKRHIGNDYVSIVFTECEDSGYTTESISGQFNCVHFVVIPKENGMFKVKVLKGHDIEYSFGPLNDEHIVSEECIGPLLRQSALHANYACRCHHEDNSDSALQRLKQIYRIRDRCGLVVQENNGEDDEKERSTSKGKKSLFELGKSAQYRTANRARQMLTRARGGSETEKGKGKEGKEVTKKEEIVHVETFL